MSVVDLLPPHTLIGLAGTTVAALGAYWIGWRAHAKARSSVQRPSALAATGDDLDERRRLEAALRDSEERFRALTEAAPDAIVMIRAGGCIEHVNPQTAALFGHAAEELLGRNLAMLMPPELAAQHEACLGRHGGGRARHAFGSPREVQGRHRDGSLLPMQLSVGEIRLSDGLHFVGFMRDLGERALREQLQRQLIHAQKLDALGQLTVGIAHDFNNMLAGILGLSQLALERQMAAPGSKLELYLQEIAKVSVRGQDMVARMLAYSRRDAPLPAQPLDVAAASGDIARMLGRTLPGGIELVLHGEAGLPGVRLAEAELHQLLMNLVINARDAIGERGRIVVDVTGRDGADGICASCGAAMGGRHVVLSVADDGSGIGPQALARIFEPFFTTKEVGRGTGLGLPMVKDIAHAAGGHVTVASEPGHGTTISVWLPGIADGVRPAHGTAGVRKS